MRACLRACMFGVVCSELQIILFCVLTLEAFAVIYEKVI